MLNWMFSIPNDAAMNGESFVLTIFDCKLRKKHEFTDMSANE